MQSIISKIKNKEAVIGIVGLGYVGLPLMLRYSEENFKVIGFDIDQKKVDTLNSGNSYIEHIENKEIKKAINAGFIATVDFEKILEVDAIILCVPTPLTANREPDMSYIKSTAKKIQPYLRAGQVISLESTTYPGTTQEILAPMTKQNNLTIGKDIFLVYSPEREDPGRKDFNTKTIPKVVGGMCKNCLEVGIALYEGTIDKVVPVSSCEAAEMVKLLENIHRAVNIGLVNELKVVADKMGLDIYEIINAAATKPFGFVPYFPGPGLGGHCIPIDPFYLTWKAREFQVNTRFIELAGEINTAMPKFVIEKIAEALNDRQKSIKGSNILILGLAYKKNVDDMRESPSLEIMEELQKKGAILAYSDPHIPKTHKMRNYNFVLESIPLTEANLKAYDAVVLLTDHDKFDYGLIYEYAKLIIDTRGKFQNTQGKVVRA